jgi:hypothetical protein
VQEEVSGDECGLQARQGAQIRRKQFEDENRRIREELLQHGDNRQYLTAMSICFAQRLAIAFRILAALKRRDISRAHTFGLR